MEIIYLKKYKQYKESGAGNAIKRFGKPRGLSEAEIEQMELEMNNGLPFPKAYREFLFLGGEYATIQMSNYGKNTPKGAEYYRNGLRKRKVNITRPFAIVDIFEESGTFIYLDEGDNPQPRNCSLHKAYDNDNDEIIWDTPFKTFSELIDKLVYLAENNLGV